MIFVCSIIVAGLFTAGKGSVEWDWDYRNQDKWNGTCAEGIHQSPIALSRSIADIIDVSPFSLFGYGQTMTIEIENNGHSVQVKPKHRKQLPEIHGGGLPQMYRFEQLHFHWKSEHTLEGERFPLEMHLVHYAQKYGSFEKAFQHANEGGLAVVTVLFHLSPDDFQELNPLLDTVIGLQNQINKENELDGFVIKHFMPMDLAGFYRYNGSLTTPGCEEGVIWTIFTHTLPISQAQVDIFRTIRTHHNVLLRKNFRDLQPLNDRQILLKISPMGLSGSNIHVLSNVNLIVLSCIYIFFIFTNIN